MQKNILRDFKVLLSKFKNLNKYRSIDIQGLKDACGVPLASRLELQKWDPFQSPERPFVFYEATGGKGGKNFFIGINKDSHRRMVRRTIQALKLMKVKRGENCLNLLFSDLVERGITGHGGVLMSVGDVHSSKTFKLAYDALKTLDIKHVFAAPNLLWDILLPLGKSHGIKKCMVSGELLLPWFRKYFYENTGIALYNWYGSSGGFIAAQDTPRGEFMKILDDGLYLEVIDKYGKSSQVGEGYLVYTDLYNYSTPIIRYMLEDWVEVKRRGRNRYIKVCARQGDHLKLDGELVYKGYIANELQKILKHDGFSVLIDKTTSYQDVIIVLLPATGLKCKKQIESFFLKNIGLKPLIKESSQSMISKFNRSKGRIFDRRSFSRKV